MLFELGGDGAHLGFERGVRLALVVHQQAEPGFQLVVLRDEGFPLGEEGLQMPGILEHRGAFGLGKLPEGFLAALRFELG